MSPTTAVRAACMPLKNGKWDTAYPQSNLTALVVQMVKNLPALAGDTGSVPELGRSPGEEMATHPVFLPGNSYGQSCLAGYSPWEHKESDMTEQL